MKIIKFVNDLGYGGTQRCAQNYAIGLSQRGHDVRVCAYSQLGPRASMLERENIPVSLLDDIKSNWSAYIGDAEIIHIHREGTANKKTTEFLIKLRSMFPGIAIVETNVFSRVDEILPAGVVDMHFQLSDWCLVKYLKWARGLKYVPPAMVVPYVVDAQKFEKASGEDVRSFLREQNIPEKSIVFGRIGQPIEGKWNSCVIDAFVEANIAGSYLALVAAPESHVCKVEALPAEIRDRIRIINFLKGDAALRPAFSSFDAFVHAAMIGESFGMVLAESILCETPVICLSTPLKDNTQSLLIPECEAGVVARSTGEMVRAMQDVAHRRRHWREQGIKARELLVRNYGFETIMPRLELGYERALEMRRGGRVHWLDEQKSAKARVKGELAQHGFTTRAKFEAVHTPWIYRQHRKRKFLGT